jgi:hypothetical protein
MHLNGTQKLGAKKRLSEMELPFVRASRNAAQEVPLKTELSLNKIYYAGRT